MKSGPSIKALILVVGLSLLLSPFQNCAPPGESIKRGVSGTSSSSRLDAKTLYELDQLLIDSQAVGAADVDLAYNSAFSKVFAGQTPLQVRKYLDARIKIVYAESTTLNDQFEPGTLDYFDWLKNEIAIFGTQATAKTITMAYNLGTALWLIGKVNETNVTYRHLGTVPNEVFVLNSSRTGLIILGEGYSETNPYNSKMKFYPELRIATLVHEARHSDCTGGIPANFIDAAKTAVSHEDLLATMGIEQMQCGHLHVECPSTSSLAGIAACDADVWGAYGVGSVFTMANLKNYPEGDSRRAFVESILADSLSRLPDDAINSIMTTSPNMSHSSGVAP